MESAMAEVLPEEHQQNGTAPHSAGHQPENHSISYSTKQRRPSVDKDAQEMVIDSLRSQIQDLISQVSQLNNKLVKSYDRVSDLEDDLHVASANVRTSSLKISQLELERTQHLSALNTGLLVEKSHVTAELTRLMEKATEEAAQRGQAESARNAIEKDLDDLSASLFGQANSMVAEARYDKHLSERKVEDAERALKSAEEAVQLMQVQMQAMQAEREEAEKKTYEMEVMVGKGKWVERRDGDVSVSLRLLSTHSPYQDYMAFIAHLRILHPTSPNTPAMSTLLQLPFLSRLMTEDSESTVRLDLAPSLNWLSRRSVLAAIHSGQLTIEPMSTATLFAESTIHPASTTIAGINSSNDNIACALCGVPIFPTSDSPHSSRPPVHPQSHIYQSQPTSWSGAFFKKTNSIGYSNGNTQPSSPTTANYRGNPNSQIFIFRLASPSTTITSLPIPSLTKSSSQPNSSPIPSSYASSSSNSIVSHSQSGSQSSQPTTIYPLCMSGWCLHRLRTTCTLWAFVRTGIVDKIWEEELPPPPPPPSSIHVEKGANGDKPPIPPRKRGIWGIASAFGERAASWSEGDRDKAKRNSGTSTPPVQPEPRRLPPPLPPVSAARASSIPPPLPKRNEGRGRTPLADTPPPPAPALPPRASTESNTADPVLTNGSDPAPAPPRTSAELPPVPPRRSHEVHPKPPADVPAVPPRPPRTHTPVNVPLPDSRPTSPAVPSRTASPANIAAVVAGPPPPLPRRAAARARALPGGSRPVTPANVDATAPAPAAPAVVLEKPATAAEPTAEDNAQAKEGVKVEDGAAATEHTGESVKVEAAPVSETKSATEPHAPASAEAPAATKEEEVAEAVEQEEKKEDAPPHDRSLQPSPGSDVFVDAPTPGDSEEEVADSIAVAAENASNVEGKKKEEKDEVKEGSAPEKQDDEDEDNRTIVDSPATTVLGSLPAEEEAAASATDKSDLAKSEAVEQTVDEEALPEYEAHVKEEVEVEAEPAVPEKTAEEKKEEDKRRKEKEEWERANYVGDATWEERTWKEVTRLREDMFWARVGGIRE